MSNPVFSLAICFALGGYLIGKRTNKAMPYALIGVVLSVVVYFAVYVVMAQLASATA